MHTGQPMPAYSAAATAMRGTALRRLRRSTVSTIGSTPARGCVFTDNAGPAGGPVGRPRDETDALRNRDCKVTSVRSTKAPPPASSPPAGPRPRRARRARPPPSLDQLDIARFPWEQTGINGGTDAAKPVQSRNDHESETGK